MAGLLSYSRDEAAALPLSARTVETVIARSRTAVLAQLALSVGVVVVLGWTGDHTTGWIGWLFNAAAILSLWGVLATVLSAWDHFRVSAALKKTAAAELARADDPKKFWWTYRGVFPFSWT
jgi:hypothetical protein